MIRFTNAPAAYDYEWTVLSSEDVGIGDHGAVYRRVELDDREDGYYAEYQIQRYQSGMYMVATEEVYADLVERGYAKTN